jgi:DTW domain-containing protein YfiP
MCAEIPRLATRTEVWILRHTLERHKHSNSARWAELALPSCRIIDYGGRDQHRFDATPWADADLWLVYPGASGKARPVGRPRVLLFLDGTWAQTRRMLQRNPGLVALPRLSLDGGPPRRRLRRPPQGGLATLEAIAAALGTIESQAVAAELDALYLRAVELSCDLHEPGG